VKSQAEAAVGAPGAPAAALAFARFAAAAREARARARVRSGAELERDLLLAGTRLRLRFAGPELERLLLPALAHAVVDHEQEAAAAVTIDLWDSASSGVAAPELPLRIRDVRERGAIPRYSDHRFETLFHGDLTDPDHDFRAVSTFDRATRHGVLWVLSPERVPWWERAAPLRTLLHWALTRPPTRMLVHAAAVGANGRGVLLAGAAGSGKSTTAAACVEAGMSCAGDDYVLLDASANPVAHPLYGTVKLAADGLALLPALDAAAAAPARDGEKHVLDLAACRSGMARAVPVDAVVVPRPTGARYGAPVLRPASGALALRALAPTTILQLAGSNRGVLSALAKLVRRVPAYELELGAPPRECAAALAALMEPPIP
jgi:hypothetical protein